MENRKKEMKACPTASNKWKVFRHPARTGLRLAFLICLLFGLTAMPARAEEIQAEDAQDELQLKQLRVQVLPEYDDPRVLVIIQGRLDLPAEAFPRKVTFRIPAGAQVNQMANLNMETGGTLSQPYEISPDPENPDWSLISYTLDNAHFFYEYYFNQIEGDVSKSFTFRFHSLHDIEKLNLEIQQPLAASDFDLEPKADYTRLDEVFGFTYYCFNLESVSLRDEIQIEIQYTKPCTAPSLAKVNPADLMDAGSYTAAHISVAGREDPADLPPWTLLVMGSIIAAGMVSFIWLKNSRDPADKPFLKIFNTLTCPYCSKKLVPGANFCHHCGKETGRR